MSLNVSAQTEARVIEEARKLGISVDALLERLLTERSEPIPVSVGELPELPVLHLGPMGPLHRTDIYDDIG